MNTTLLIVILVLGLVLLALEIVALPGGVAGIFGLGLLIYGVWQSYHLWGEATGNIILLVCTAITAILLVIFLKAKTWKRFSLNEESSSAVNQVDEGSIAVGSYGRTIARLAPTGKALIDDELVEVHAINKFIDPDRPIKVVGIEGYRVDVVEVPNDNRFEEAISSVENKTNV